MGPRLGWYIWDTMVAGGRFIKCGTLLALVP